MFNPKSYYAELKSKFLVVVQGDIKNNSNKLNFVTGAAKQQRTEDELPPRIHNMKKLVDGILRSTKGRRFKNQYPDLETKLGYPARRIRLLQGLALCSFSIYELLGGQPENFCLVNRADPSFDIRLEKLEANIISERTIREIISHFDPELQEQATVLTREEQAKQMLDGVDQMVDGFVLPPTAPTAAAIAAVPEVIPERQDPLQALSLEDITVDTLPMLLNELSLNDLSIYKACCLLEFYNYLQSPLCPEVFHESIGATEPTVTQTVDQAAAQATEQEAISGSQRLADIVISVIENQLKALASRQNGKTEEASPENDAYSCAVM